MGKKYNNNITTTAGFNYPANQPLDDRDVVEKYSDLATLVSSNIAYEGIEVYVVEKLKSYKLIDGGWKAVATEAYIDSKLLDIEGGNFVNIQSDWSIDDKNDPAYIKNKPNILTEDDIRELIPEYDGTGGSSGNVDLDNYYTRAEVDSKISSVYRYCGSVNNVDTLPSLTLGENSGNTYNLINGANITKTFNCSLTGRTVYWVGSEFGITIKNSSEENISHLFISGTILTCNVEGSNYSITLKRLEGDKWIVDSFADVGWSGFTITQYQTPIKSANGDNIAWTGYCWDNLGNVIDLNNYYTREEVDNEILKETSGLPNHAYIQNEITLALGNRYTKTEVDNMIGDISTVLDAIIEKQSQY